MFLMSQEQKKTQIKDRLVAESITKPLPKGCKNLLKVSNHNVWHHDGCFKRNRDLSWLTKQKIKETSQMFAVSSESRYPPQISS